MLLMIFQMTSWMPFSQFSLTNTSLPHWPQKVSVETTCAACWGFWGISQFQWSIISWSISTIAFQKLLTESSHALYESLDQRVFFKSATIVIPKTWLDGMCQTVIHEPKGNTAYRYVLLISKYIVWWLGWIGFFSR